MSGLNLVVLRDPVPVWDAAAPAPPGPRLDFELIRERISGQYVSSASLKSPLARRLAGGNSAMAAAFATFEVRAQAANVFTTGEEIAFRLLPLLNASSWKGRLFSVIHSSHSFKWRQAARLLGTAKVGTYFTVSTQQRDVLVQKAGLPADKVVFIHHSVDADFYDPSKAPAASGEGYVFACGLENRDYATLTAAAAQVPWPVRVQAYGFFPQADARDEGLPANLEINRTRLSHDDLRARYAGARFVVVPLHAVPYAAGATGILEAMAMGKAVIATQSSGLADYIAPDTILKVPAGDPARLADAMGALWRDPAACEEMGRANREWVLRHASIERYTAAIADRILAD
ncbi:MAG: glycosyltransferase family 4 protein [Alphaproteobacteria bacterium]|uniref:glycosyltransferase family 4 protein n=1 Tax=Hyphomonas sp. TaxID=87 RepID=UPI001DB987B0|nr:glycosyltransferase family 4 protein [Hyphomonas sp.]MBU4062170.1 glycosyltransferase family 4 protein [Alphaproteobacteria bacterium]MBU4165605.1 glycosyltransferase family 4 protein [Alphaproteobacteria bacterium]MBU4567393.1 glycosyltransferase family 4 protein [Alphaproteobacteria bacterium]